MEKIQHMSMAREVAQRLCKFVEYDKLVEGSRFPGERELSERLGVARTSIREGIKLLEAMEIVKVEQGKGMFLQRLSLDEVLSVDQTLARLVRLQKQDLIDIMKARRLLEAETARLAAHNATDRDRLILRESIRQMEEVEGDKSLYVQSDFAFHIGVAKAAGNRAMVKLVEQLRNLYIERWVLAIHVAELPGVTQRSCQQHRKILAAIQAGDGEQASQAMIEHIDSNKDRIVNSHEDW